MSLSRSFSEGGGARRDCLPSAFRVPSQGTKYIGNFAPNQARRVLLLSSLCSGASFLNFGSLDSGSAWVPDVSLRAIPLVGVGDDC